MLTAIGKTMIDWADRQDPWTNVYGVARTLLALSLALTLVFNDAATLYHPAVGLVASPFCESGTIVDWNIFCWGLDADITRWLCVVALVVVASGWRPRLTGLVHWWITVSVPMSATLVDGGEQVAAVLTMLLVPVTLTDPRTWHWQPASGDPPANDPARVARLVRLWRWCWSGYRWPSFTFMHPPVSLSPQSAKWHGPILLVHPPDYGADDWRIAALWPIISIQLF